MRSISILLWAAVLPMAAQIPSGDWPTYTRDLAGTKYSPLNQITPENVDKLVPAWTYTLRAEPPRASSTAKSDDPFATPGAARTVASAATPIVVHGVMYLPEGNRVVALDPVAGAEIWSYTLPTGVASQRGVAYWPGDKQNPPRVLFTSGHLLIALNANTGKIDPGFGNEGQVDMVVPYSGVPTVYKNVAMIGATVGEVPVGLAGDSRAYDARSGAKLWDFHSVPRPGELGHETWLNDGWKGRSGVNVWGWYMTVDEQRGIVYMTFGGPAANYWGGDRPGANLFANSVVAVDRRTSYTRCHAVHRPSCTSVASCI
jgi:quinoprotein glucose dehydrogenase